MAVTETIQEILQGIDDAQYGRDMREFIHKGIEKCYEEGHAGETDLEARNDIADISAFLTLESAQMTPETGKAFQGTVYKFGRVCILNVSRISGAFIGVRASEPIGTVPDGFKPYQADMGLQDRKAIGCFSVVDYNNEQFKTGRLYIYKDGTIYASYEPPILESNRYYPSNGFGVYISEA